MKRTTLLGIGALVIAGAGLIWISQRGNHGHNEHGIKLPRFSEAAKQGAELYSANCIACHGKNTMGTENGPPFLHKIYEPSHHGDASFQRAAKSGVRAHHWPFGNMPPVPAVTPADVTLITKYVRELQRANGIQ